GYIGVRPEALTITDKGLPATVSLVEPLGAETLIHLTMGEDTVIMRGTHGLDLTPGQEVHVTAPQDTLRTFDKSGRATL
ncbi:MAG: TOBE domain-containing protein, partial [Pseudomonadota bacterium]